MRNRITVQNCEINVNNYQIRAERLLPGAEGRHNKLGAGRQSDKGAWGMRNGWGGVLKLNEILFEIILVRGREMWYNIAKNFCGRGTYE